MSSSSTVAPAGGHFVVDSSRNETMPKDETSSDNGFSLWERLSTMEILLLFMGVFEKCFLSGCCFFFFFFFFFFRLDFILQLI